MATIIKPLRYFWKIFDRAKIQKASIFISNRVLSRQQLKYEISVWHYVIISCHLVMKKLGCDQMELSVCEL